MNNIFSIERTDGGYDAGIRAYNMTIGLCLFYGFAVNYIVVRWFAGYFMNMNPMGLLIGYVLCVIAGSVLCNGTESFGRSFVGYTLIVVPIGAVLSTFLPYYSSTVIASAFLGTALIAGGMVLLAAVKPEIFETLGGTLFTALLIAIVVQLLLTLFRISSGMLDWAIVVIFAGYIGYDWCMANRCYPSPVNAVKSACALYLDLVNIFIRLVAIFGRNNRN